jgi:hypothetical protein
VQAVVNPADSGDGVAPADDELVGLALVVHRLRLGQRQRLEVQPDQNVVFRLATENVTENGIEDGTENSKENENNTNNNIEAVRTVLKIGSESGT